MSIGPFHVDPDPARARTPLGSVYADPDQAAREDARLWPRAWHLAPPPRHSPPSGALRPFALRAGGVDEPLVLTRDVEGQLRCLSNVCTHRAMLLAEQPETRETLRCGYHGRTFGLDGRMQRAPGFEGCEDFPTAADDLPRAAIGEWRGFTFVGLQPRTPFERFIAPAERWLGPWLDAGALPDRAESTTWEVEANWALYVENYLESFHIPFVHPGLARTVELARVRVEPLDEAVVQIVDARDGEPAFEPPSGHPDSGRRIAAYFLWLFPTTMLNLYPWGLSVNRVEPLAPDRTRIVFDAYVRHPELRATGAGADLAQVEREDEQIVEGTQRGVRARLYHRGRYAPRHEAGTHRFHRLLADYVAGHGELPESIEL